MGVLLVAAGKRGVGLLKLQDTLTNVIMGGATCCSGNRRRIKIFRTVDDRMEVSGIEISGQGMKRMLEYISKT